VVRRVGGRRPRAKHGALHRKAMASALSLAARVIRLKDALRATRSLVTIRAMTNTSDRIREEFFSDIGQELARIRCHEIVLLEVTSPLEAVFSFASAKVAIDAEDARRALQEVSPDVASATVWAALLQASD
jgi:hypothetical protein